VIFEELHPITNLIENQAIKTNLDKAINTYLYVKGCNHPKASNYDQRASVDDGTCIDPPVIPRNLRCSGTGLVESIADGCVDDGGRNSGNDYVQIFCCNGMKRFCLSGEACSWRSGCPAQNVDNGRTCSRSGLGNDWMATVTCPSVEIKQIFCDGNEKVTLKN
jgi:hypothetical protein